ncbi:MAG: TolC family protein [Verrucomicrobia bacterium]|jgi:outer membrane protein TolC|nr:TolC family protein [Verrucomicrobiota bacterium]OQC67553.1 MAG: Outer membrane protein OprM precursor [Verrucomicrobia bacterium ADurb.Bin006]MDI9382534.1 TolC family protein [Verrucomicrobiota bacterium]NMD19904.1 TolC family protein [Verrucomicrobiota bacterium]HOA60889.1 TolC family protein [Verrucomicrobiota bacterium]
MNRARWILVAMTAAWVAWPIRAAESRPISLEECISLALEHNLDLQIERLNPLMRNLDLWGSYSAYDPTFTGRYNHRYNMGIGGYDTSINTVTLGTEDDTDSGSLGLGGLLPTGGRYELTANGSHTVGTQPAPTALDPSARMPYRTSDANAAAATLTQPLLKNFWIDAARYNITLRKKELQYSEYVLQRRIMETVTAVETAYYGLIAAVEQVKVQKQALQEADQQLRENRKRVEVGVMAPLDEKDAESQVAASRANLLAAQKDLIVRQNALKALVTDQYGEWAEMDLAPTESLSAVPVTFSRSDSWAKALSLRPDLLGMKVELEKRQLTLRYDRNQLYPQLDIVGSYGQSGRRSTFWDALDDMREGVGNSYSYGVVLSVPLSNRQARYNYRKSKQEIEQALLQLKRQEQQIMHEVEDAIAEARSSYEQIEARRQASEFAQAAYEAEQKKLENGKSTSFQVLVLQRQLTQRRYEEISALSTYNRALADLALKEGTTLDRLGIVLTVKP